MLFPVFGQGAQRMTLAEKSTRRLSDWIGLIEAYVVVPVQYHHTRVLSTSIAALPFRVQRGWRAPHEHSLVNARAALWPHAAQLTTHDSR